VSKAGFTKGIIIVQFNAFWSDGQTAARHTVRVLTFGDELAFTSADGVKHNWLISELRLLEHVYPGRPVRLYREHPDAGRHAGVLTLEDGDTLRELAAHNPKLRRQAHTKHSAGQRVLGWGAVLLLLIAALVFGVPKLAGPITAVIPYAWEQELAATTDELILADQQLCADPNGQAVLDALTARLLQQHAWPHAVRVNVVDNPQVNALAAPGGQVLIFRGLLDEAESPDEVAGVLAHELAHVIERHALESLVRNLGIAFSMTMIFGDFSGLSSSVGRTVLQLSYSRDTEREADAIGAQLLNQADIRGDGLVTFFERLQQQQDDLPDALALFSTHPLDQERAAFIKAKMIGAQPALRAEEWQHLQGMCLDAAPEE